MQICFLYPDVTANAVAPNITGSLTMTDNPRPLLSQKLLTLLARRLVLSVLQFFMLCGTATVVLMPSPAQAISNETSAQASAQCMESVSDCNAIVAKVDMGGGVPNVPVNRWMINPNVPGGWSFFDVIGGGSGPTCSFALNGTPCPPVFDSAGTFPLGANMGIGGLPLSGSTLSMSSGSVDYTLPPGGVLLPVDETVFDFVFLAPETFSTVGATVTYFDVPGNYEFMLSNNSCNDGTLVCGADVPIYGFNLSIPDLPISTPEPSTIWIVALGIVAISVTRWRRSPET